jgi:uncharacterized membrane protein YqiK
MSSLLSGVIIVVVVIIIINIIFFFFSLSTLSNEGSTGIREGTTFEASCFTANPPGIAFNDNPGSRLPHNQDKQ